MLLDRASLIQDLTKRHIDPQQLGQPSLDLCIRQSGQQLITLNLEQVVLGNFAGRHLLAIWRRNTHRYPCVHAHNLLATKMRASL